MAIFKSIFNKKKDRDSDGQEEFFKEDFAPVVVVPKKAEPVNAEPKAKPESAKPVTKASSTKPGDRRYVPQPVERIINPNAGKKKTAVSQSEKPVAKKPTPAKNATSAKKTTTKAEAPAQKVAHSKTAVPAKKVAPVKAASTKKATPAKATAPAKKVSTKPVKLRQEIDDSSFVKGAVPIKDGNGKWDIQRAKDGRFFFSLYASNHTVIAYSQIYSSTTAVTTGINSVITNAPKAEIEDTTLKKIVSVPCPKWEIYLDKAEQYRFRLYAPNGLIVCHSAHGYATKGGCKGGIESIKRFASEEASIKKSYLNKD